MSENEFREWIWTSCSRRIIEMIEKEAAGWTPNGQAQAVATAITNKIRRMPVPHQKAEALQ